MWRHYRLKKSLDCSMLQLSADFFIDDTRFLLFLSLTFFTKVYNSVR